MVDFHNSSKLKAALKEWVSDGVISADQAKILSDKYQLEAEEPWYKDTSFYMKGLVFLVLALVALLLLGNNWNGFAVWLQTSIALTPLVISYVAGIYFHFRPSTIYTRAAELSFFFSTLMLGVNIMMQAQIYHISAYYPDGVLWWLIGGLPFVFIYRSQLHIYLSHLLFFIWIWFQISHNQFHPFAPVILGLYAFFLYREKAKLLLWLTIINSFMFLLNLSSLRIFYRTDDGVFPVLIGVFFVLLPLCVQYLKGRFTPDYLDRVKSVFLLLQTPIFYMYTIAEISDELMKAPLPVIGFIAFLLSLAMFIHQRKFDIAIMIPLAFVSLLVVLNLAEAVIHLGISESAIKIAVNSGFVLAMLYSIWYSLKNKVKFYYVMGIVWLLLWVIAKYLSYFNDYLTGALILGLFAVGLFILNRYWDKRYAK